MLDRKEHRESLSSRQLVSSMLSWLIHRTGQRELLGLDDYLKQNRIILQEGRPNRQLLRSARWLPISIDTAALGRGAARRRDCPRGLAWPKVGLLAEVWGWADWSCVPGGSWLMCQNVGNSLALFLR